MNNLIDAKHALLTAEVGDSESTRLVMTLLTTTRQIDAVCTQLLSRHGLSEARYAALLAVNTTPGITPGDLAERLSVTGATVTGLLDGLVAAGLITRSVARTDRRRQELRVTTAAQTLLDTLTPLYSEWLGQLTAGVSAPDRNTVIEALRSIQGALRKAAGS